MADQASQETVTAEPTGEVKPLPVRENRDQFFDQLFNQTTPQLQSNLDLKKALSTYEDLHHKNMKVWWDATTLRKYCNDQIIPRGLRLRKLPTTVYSETFFKKWEDVLLQASLKLMGLIIEEEERILADQKKELDTTMQTLKSLEHLENYQHSFQEVEDRLEKMERRLMELKQKKYIRDLEDYKLNKVHNWSRKGGPRAQSILKKRRYKRGVTFSGSETSDGSSASGAASSQFTSEESLNSGNSKSSKNGAKNEARITKQSNRMNLRSTQKPDEPGGNIGKERK